MKPPTRSELRRPPKPPPSMTVSPEPPVQVTEEELYVEAEKAVKEEAIVVETLEEEIAEVAAFTRGDLEEVTVKDLMKIINANEDFGKPPKGTKKQDLIDLILEKQ